MSILDAIDNAIADHELSADAMRWTPEPPSQIDPLKLGHTTAEYSAAAERLGELMRANPSMGRALGPAVCRNLVDEMAAAEQAQARAAMLGASPIAMWIDEPLWLRCITRRPERLSRIRRAYRARRR